jgi:4'-phosphopantetheinyl transferase
MTSNAHGPAPGEVHVWAVPEPELRDEATHQRCRKLLSPGELARWEHMAPTQQMLFASAHAGLRAVTAAYTGLWPSQVDFVTGRHGKPYVAGRPGLRISLSHTRGMSLVAVSRDGSTGVDIERVRPLDDARPAPDLVFSPWEQANWEQGPRRTRSARFFSYWACKEAVLKALGTGLTGDLTAVQVDPGEALNGPVPIRGLPRVAGRDRAWTLQLVNIGPRYRAAVAVAGGGVRLRTFQLPSGTLPHPSAGTLRGGSSGRGRGPASGPQRPFGTAQLVGPPQPIGTEPAAPSTGRSQELSYEGTS